MKTIFGSTVEFEESEFKSFIETIDNKQSLQLIESALIFAAKLGVFDIEENYVIYKCLESLKRDEG